MLWLVYLAVVGCGLWLEVKYQASDEAMYGSVVVAIILLGAIAAVRNRPSKSPVRNKTDSLDFGDKGYR